MKLNFVRRLGEKARRQCSSGHYCPQLLELADGDFVAVGLDVTAETVNAMLPGPGVGPLERAVRIPRQVMIGARSDIPTV